MEPSNLRRDLTLEELELARGMIAQSQAHVINIIKTLTGGATKQSPSFRMRARENSLQ